MIGIVTLKDLNGIMDEYGLQVAMKALSWKGTWLNFLVANDFFC
jgi:hypothetical protein